MLDPHTSAVTVPNILLQNDASGVIEPIAHAQLLWVFVMLTLLLFTARALGEIAKRFDLPAVVGELLAGILLGPSLLDSVTIVFGIIFESGTAVDPQFHLIEVVSWIGLLMLIILTGLETDLDLIVSRGVDATVIALASIIVPFVLGFGFAWVLPDRFLAGEGQRLVFSLFVGIALSISALPVIAKILMDMEVIRRDFGQMQLAVGMINDTIGWILLALVAGLAEAGTIELTSLGQTILYLVIFLGVGLTVGQRAVRWLLRWVDDVIGGQVAMITTVMVLALGVGAFTHYLHLEAVLGAFVVGILVGQVNRFDYEAEHTFEMVTLGVFAPIFFATAGLRVDLSTMADPVVLGVGAAALVIAIVGKFVGSYVGSIAAGMGHWEGITMGAGLNARGAMEIIVAMIGLGLGVLTVEMYSIIVMIAIVTSLMAPPLLRKTIPRLEMSEQERKRLEREQQQAESFLGQMTTVLQPTRCSVDSQYGARLLGHMTQDTEIDVTAMYLQAGEEDQQLGFIDRLRLRLFRRSKGQQDITDSDTTAEESIPTEASDCLERMDQQFDPSGERSMRGIARNENPNLKEAILKEAKRDYDLLTIGTAERGAKPNDPPLGDLVDEIIQDTPCPVMAVHANVDGVEGLAEESISRILLPTVGAEFNRHAAEVAFAIARDRNALVEIVHVVNEPRIGDRFMEEPDLREARQIGEEIVDEEAELGRKMGAEIRTNVVVTDREPEDELVELASDHRDDLIVMGTSIRPTSRRAFLGHTSEYIIRNADAAVAVVSSR
ncbi:cation:proton antiporter [Haloprofundus halobius]|uniref:cation:proton antiporter domain-containing protein n=1 Tax=Haloprofundus halobius TaxID=2876194 RepID=UPI001CC98113|nr:cation:proton antiporter [Haloprofundus halobius]